MNRNPSRSEIRRHFPHLNDTKLVITSPRTPTYNCIAYAAGDHTRWWWPDSIGLFYWPPIVQRVEKLPAFQQAFEALGYELAPGFDLEPNFERVAIFCREGKPTHAAKQLPTGLWSSKLGQLEDISHDFSGLNGDSYGTAAIAMKRRRRDDTP